MRDMLESAAGSPGDLRAVAIEAGLRYVEDGAPGYSRLRRGRGFSFRAPDATAINGARREWIVSLAVPPAWSDVWIAIDRDAHILATGVDDAGRKQYIYHPSWNEARDAFKFEQLAEFGGRLGALRKHVERDLGDGESDRARMAALAVTILDNSLIRVGNVQYLDANDSYGLTTLGAEHARIRGDRITLEFVGKGGVEHVTTFDHPAAADMLQRYRRLRGPTLLSYRSGGELRSLSSDDVNSYLKAKLRRPITAKVFRTWGATTTVAGMLGRCGTANGESAAVVLEAIDEAAARLGNTREVCRSAYVHPAVPEAFLAGSLERAWANSRSGKWLSRSESAVNRILAG